MNMNNEEDEDQNPTEDVTSTTELEGGTVAPTPTAEKPLRANYKGYKTAKELELEANNLSFIESEAKLTDFQRKLVHNVVYKSMDRAAAAKSAGSSIDITKNKIGLQQLAWDTLRKPHVQVYMNNLIEKKNELAGIDKIEVIEGLREILTMAKVDGKYKDALKALELLGSAIGLFKSVSQTIAAPKKTPGATLLDEENGDSGVKKDIDKLLAMISGGPKKVK